MSKNKKAIIGILIAILMIVSGYKLIEKSVTNRKDFKFKVEDINSASVESINHEQNERSFFGKVVEADAAYIIVEPNEDEEERKSADKIFIGLDKNNDILYMFGTNVKITYDGTIMDSYPAQVEATKIELNHRRILIFFFSTKIN